jgi:protein O-GlcNAc transferase
MNIDQTLQQAITHHKTGELENAENRYRSILTEEPKHPDANHNLGVLLKQGNKAAIALPFFKTALEANPNQEQYWVSYIDTLMHLQRYDAAQNVLNQGQAKGLKGDAVDQLKERLNSTVKSGPEPADTQARTLNVNATLARAKSHAKKGQVDEARQLYHGVLEAFPQNQQAKKGLKALQEGQVNKKNPSGPPQAQIEAVISLYSQGQAQEALRASETLIKDYPNAPLLYNIRGACYKVLGQLDTAVKSYEQALAIRPNYGDAHYNLGITLQELGQLEAAVKSYEQALAIKPDNAEAQSNLGNALRELDQLEAAVKHFEQALAIKPDLAVANQGYSSLLGYMSNYDDVIRYSDIAIDLKDDPKIWESRLYSWIYHPDLSAETICAEHIRWGESFPETTKNIFSKHDRTFNRRLRIGYVSPDFREHSCRFYFEPLFSQHDQVRVELFAYSNVGLEDEHTQRFKTYFETWRNIRHISDQEASEMIRNDKIDILIDGCGHMKGSRLELFALKPAPIQVTWLGAAWTTGLKQMDYVLFDPYMAPPEIKTSEVVVQLPRTWAAYRPSEKATNTTVTVLPALQNGYITFGYSGRSERLNYKVFRTWGKLLKQLPKAQLVIDYKSFSSPSTQAYYQNFMTEQGMDISRVTLRHSTNIFTALGGIDILLDSFPHSGGTMLFDALWMGVPTITLASRPPVGRIGTSLMINLNLADWVAYTEESYIAKAVEFAADIKELAKLRSDMRERMRKSPVMDEKGFAHDVENAYRKMWRDWRTKTDT